MEMVGKRLLEKWKKRYEEDLREYATFLGSPKMGEILREDVFHSGMRYYELKIEFEDTAPPKPQFYGGDDANKGHKQRE